MALALGAGVVMSALAIDLTDAAVASAILAAGVSILLSIASLWHCSCRKFTCHHHIIDWATRR